MKQTWLLSLTFAGLTGASLLLWAADSRTQPQPPTEFGQTDPVLQEDAMTETGVDADGLPKTIPGTELELSETLKELIKLAERGLGDEVLIAWVMNSPEAFYLTPDEIVYLTDLGISEEVIKALIEHQGNGTPAPLPRPGESSPPPVNPPVSQAPSTNPAVAAEPAPSVVITAAPEFETAPQAVEQPAQVVYVDQPASVQYDYFYNSLAPYGSWVNISGYGLCWQPTVAVIDRTWQPYFHGGRWVYTNHGWYWNSDYTWGWAPFHYGRWRNHPGRGWLWAPDTVWSPAWVTWRWSNSYCGWAPLPPGSHYRAGVGLTYRHSWSSGISASFGFGLGYDDYAFVPATRFCDPRPWRHRLPRHHVAGIINQTTVINNITHNHDKVIVNEGPGRNRVAAVVRSEVPKVTIRDLPERGEGTRTIRSERFDRGGREIAVYRPFDPALPSESTEAGSRITRREVERPQREAGLNTEPSRTISSVRRTPGVVSVNPRRDLSTSSSRVESARTSVSEPGQGRTVTSSVPIVRSQVTQTRASAGTAQVQNPVRSAEPSRFSPDQQSPLSGRAERSPATINPSPVRQSPRPIAQSPATRSASPGTGVAVIRSADPGRVERSEITRQVTRSRAEPSRAISEPLVVQRPATIRSTVPSQPRSIAPSAQSRIQTPAVAPSRAPTSRVIRQEVTRPAVITTSPSLQRSWAPQPVPTVRSTPASRVVSSPRPISSSSIRSAPTRVQSAPARVAAPTAVRAAPAPAFRERRISTPAPASASASQSVRSQPTPVRSGPQRR